MDHLEATIAVRANRERVQAMIRDGAGMASHHTAENHRFERSIRPVVNDCSSSYTLADDGAGTAVTLGVDVVLGVRGREASDVMTRIDRSVRAELVSLRALVEKAG